MFEGKKAKIVKCYKAEEKQNQSNNQEDCSHNKILNNKVREEMKIWELQYRHGNKAEMAILMVETEKGRFSSLLKGFAITNLNNLKVCYKNAYLILKERSHRPHKLHVGADLI